VFVGSLHHYAKFDICTIVTLEKIFCVGSFGGFIGHLAHCQTIFPTFSNGFDIFSMIWITTHGCLGCWTLIVLALFIHF
jgi:hypothetical protein